MSEKKNLVNGVSCKIITELVHKQCGHYNQTNYGYCNKNDDAEMNIKLKKKSHKQISNWKKKEIGNEKGNEYQEPQIGFSATSDPRRVERRRGF